MIWRLLHIRHPADVAALALAAVLVSIIAAPHPRQAGAAMVANLISAAVTHAQASGADNVYASIAAGGQE